MRFHLKLSEKNMKKYIYATLFLLGSFSAYAQNNDDIEEVEVKGKVLYVDQVNSLKPPVPPLPKSKAFGPLRISNCSTLYKDL